MIMLLAIRGQDKRSFPSDCKPCLYNFYFAIIRWYGTTSETDQNKSDCISNSVDHRCRSCTCYSACRFGLKDLCDCCRRGACRSGGPSVQPSCPESTSFYSNKCETECGNTANNAGKCLGCLQKDVPSKCIDSGYGATCRGLERCGSFWRVCKICIYKTYFALLSCQHKTGASNILNCMASNVPKHCKQCVCWVMCLIGMENVCNYCKSKG